MSLAEIFAAAYEQLDVLAVPIFAVCVGVPLLGTALARVGRGGRTDKDGRFAADVMVVFGLAAFALELVAIGIAHFGFHQGLLQANALLLLGPLLALGLSFVGARLVFPGTSLGSIRAARAALLLAGVLLAVFWLFSQFRGWGIVFFGDVAQLVVIGTLLALLVRHLYRRALGRPDKKA